MHSCIRDQDALKVVADHRAITAIDVTRELIDRGQCENIAAIGAVDVVRRVLDRLVRDGKLRIVEKRSNRRGFAKQRVYGPMEDAVA